VRTLRLFGPDIESAALPLATFTLKVSASLSSPPDLAPTSHQGPQVPGGST
jgi:hypothetical protein